MPCVVNHEALLRKSPSITICPDCQIPLHGKNIIDLTETSSPPATPSHGRTASTSLGLIAPITATKQQLFHRFDTAHHTAKTKMSESVAKTTKQGQEMVQNVGVNIYVAEEHTDMIGVIPVVRLERLGKCKVIMPRAVSLTTRFVSQQALIMYIKDHWNVPSPFFEEANCRLIGAAGSGNGASLSELPFKPDEPIQLSDIKSITIDSGNVKERFIVNLYFPQVVESGSESHNQPDSSSNRKRRQSSVTPKPKRARLNTRLKTEVKSESKQEDASNVKHEQMVDGSHIGVEGISRYTNLGPPLMTRGAARKGTASAREETNEDITGDEEIDLSTLDTAHH